VFLSSHRPGAEPDVLQRLLEGQELNNANRLIRTQYLIFRGNSTIFASIAGRNNDIPQHSFVF
jgi:hypothetical protein